MHEKEIRVRTSDGEMRTFTVHPDGAGPFPVAVLFMDGVGYREQVKDNARRFAEAGYYVVAPDLYYRAGEVAFDLKDEAARDKMMEVVRTVKPAGVVEDVKAVFKAIESDPAAGKGPNVAVGYCLGARMSLAAASAMPDRFVAAAAVHPGALVNDTPESPHHDLATVEGELYVAFAEIDRTATPESVARFREEARAKGVRGEIERIPGATHGFAMADLPMYDRDAAEQHFEKVLDLWERNLKSRAASR